MYSTGGTGLLEIFVIAGFLDTKRSVLRAGGAGLALIALVGIVNGINWFTVGLVEMLQPRELVMGSVGTIRHVEPLSIIVVVVGIGVGVFLALQLTVVSIQFANDG